MNIWLGLILKHVGSISGVEKVPFLEEILRAMIMEKFSLQMRAKMDLFNASSIPWATHRVVYQVGLLWSTHMEEEYFTW